MCFNLPGRFGFGRTGQRNASCALDKMFQSARQIWVWPNAGQIAKAETRIARVSICQADLGLAERNPTAPRRSVPTGFNLPGRFGFGRTRHRGNALHRACGFNLPGRFGFGRTSILVLSSPRARRFNLPGRFGFGRTRAVFARTAAVCAFQSARQIWVWPNEHADHMLTRVIP